MVGALNGGLCVASAEVENEWMLRWGEGGGRQTHTCMTLPCAGKVCPSGTEAQARMKKQGLQPLLQGLACAEAHARQQQ